MAVDANGVQFVDVEGTLPTYAATAYDYTPYATATDMFVLQNPANSGSLLNITQINISGTAQSAATMDVYVFIRTSLNTGGTSSAVTPAKYDSRNGSPKGTALTYSVAPTVPSGSMVVADRIVLPGNNPGVSATIINYDFGNRGGSTSLHLHPGEQLSISNNGNAVATGATMYFTVEWNESTGYTPV